MLNLEKVNYFCYNQTLSARIHEQKSHRFQIGFKNLVLASGYLFSDMAHFAAIFLRKNKSTSEINSDWKRIRQKYYQFFINEKFQKVSFVYLYFTYLCASWSHQRILKKYPFLKCDSWFPTGVSKFTSVKYPWKDTFSGMFFFVFFHQYCPSNSFCSH